jgi:hypothetical protein
MNRGGGYRGGGGDASADAEAVLQAAIQQLAAREQQQHGHAAPEPTPAAAKRPEAPSYLHAERFQGARQGYFFGTGDEGTGLVLC